jgi:Flp pilus assembly pilin Flp
LCSYELCSGILGIAPLTRGDLTVANRLKALWSDESGQDVAEYAVMLAVILVIVVGTIRLIGSNANNVFSQVGSSLNQ